jgi:hypothetical protein
MRYSKEFLVNVPAQVELAKRSMEYFTDYMMKSYDWNWHHRYICHKLDNFLHGKIQKLMIFVPPQHGKSELTSRLFPAYAFGKNPDLKLAVVSYNHPFSAKFNRSVQRYIDSTSYHDVFPDVQLNAKNVRNFSRQNYLRNSDEFEIVGYSGGLRSVGIGGGITGNAYDIVIIDDPVKDYVEASSIAFQTRNWEWYNSSLLTRLDNNAKVLIIQTRWHVHDLSGMILKKEKEIGEHEFEVVNIPAIKENDEMTCEGWDKRKKGEALWERKHSKAKILKVKKQNKKTYLALFQGNPEDPEEIKIIQSISEMGVIPELELPTLFALDFGFSKSQCAACQIWIDVINNLIYARQIVYATGQTNQVTAKHLKEYGIMNQVLVCDSAEPKSIAELEAEGLNAVGIVKPSKEALILFLKNFRFIFEGDDFEFERDNWKHNTDAFAFPLGGEVDKYNHLMKALAYGVYYYFNQEKATKTEGANIKRKKKTRV